MNVDLPIELRDALQPWTQQLPPANDDPDYTRRYRKLIAHGHHPAIAAVLADNENIGAHPSSRWIRSTNRRQVAC